MPYSPERRVRYEPSRSHGKRFLLPALLNWRRRSLLRGTLLVLVSTIASFRLSHFPNNQANLWLIVPLVAAILGTADTLRCMQPRWNWYHGGVVLCVYTDLMAICLIIFFLVYPIWL